jgi:hypothetical protein
MTKESFIVHNATRNTLSFRLDKACTGEIAEKSMYKQRKLIRGGSNYVAVPPGQALDLVIAGQLTIQEIKDSTEFRMVFDTGRLVLIYDSSDPAHNPEIDESDSNPDPIEEGDKITEAKVETECSNDFDPIEEEDKTTEEELRQELEAEYLECDPVKDMGVVDAVIPEDVVTEKEVAEDVQTAESKVKKKVKTTEPKKRGRKAKAK